MFEIKCQRNFEERMMCARDVRRGQLCSLILHSTMNQESIFVEVSQVSVCTCTSKGRVSNHLRSDASLALSLSHSPSRSLPQIVDRPITTVIILICSLLWYYFLSQETTAEAIAFSYESFQLIDERLSHRCMCVSRPD